jgi:hypothetical protein
LVVDAERVLQAHAAPSSNADSTHANTSERR